MNPIFREPNRVPWLVFHQISMPFFEDINPGSNVAPVSQPTFGHFLLIIFSLEGIQCLQVALAYIQIDNTINIVSARSRKYRRIYLAPYLPPLVTIQSCAYLFINTIHHFRPNSIEHEGTVGKNMYTHKYQCNPND